ncbi:MAG: hypothetical protein LBD06_07585 [Candidatus Accumulibacter sp.]|nr:hypothetical protein [Accumulibacter sp.]
MISGSRGIGGQRFEKTEKTVARFFLPRPAQSAASACLLFSLASVL